MRHTPVREAGGRGAKSGIQFDISADTPSGYFHRPVSLGSVQTPVNRVGCKYRRTRNASRRPDFCFATGEGFDMHLETLAHIDATLRDALARIERQRNFVEEFASRGYDMKAPLSLLSCLLVNLRHLERQRYELTADVEEIVHV